MKTRKILCIVNVLIAFVLFCATLGYTCFGYGVGYSFIRQWIPVCIYLFFLLPLGLILLHCNFYRPRKGLLFAAVYSLAFDCLILLAGLFLLIRGDLQGFSSHTVGWIVMIGTALISGLYFWAAFAWEY